MHLRPETLFTWVCVQSTFRIISAGSAILSYDLSIKGMSRTSVAIQIALIDDRMQRTRDHADVSSNQKDSKTSRNRISLHLVRAYASSRKNDSSQG